MNNTALAGMQKVRIARIVVDFLAPFDPKNLTILPFYTEKKHRAGRTYGQTAWRDFLFRVRTCFYCITKRARAEVLGVTTYTY